MKTFRYTLANKAGHGWPLELSIAIRCGVTYWIIYCVTPFV